MPPKNSKKICICPECEKEIKPVTKFIKKVEENTNEKEILSYFNHEIITVNDFNSETFFNSSFHITSIQSVALKLLFLSLSKYLDEIVLKITEEKIYFVKVSEDNVVFHLNLDSRNFELYTVNDNNPIYNHSDNIKETIVIYLKVDLKEFRPVFKNVKKNDTISFRKEKYCNVWELLIYNDENHYYSTYKFKNNIDKICNINISNKEFIYTLQIPSDLIDDIIKKEEVLHPNIILIKIYEQYLEFYAEKKDKTICCENKIISSVSGPIKHSSEEYNNKIVTGKYNFNKYRICQSFLNLCNCISLITSQDDVLILSVTVAHLGLLNICIPPIIS